MEPKAILYYTCNTHDPKIDELCRAQLTRAGLPITCVSLNVPLDFGDCIVMRGEKSPLMMHKQILVGLEHMDAKTVFLCESDVLYHPSHFDITPAERMFYYNTNVWRVRYPDGFAVWTDGLQQVSGLCAPRELLRDFYTRRVIQIEFEGFNRHYEPGVKQSVGGRDVINWKSEYPNICIRHNNNITKSKWSPADYRNPIYAAGWTTADTLPYWGKTAELWERT